MLLTQIPVVFITEYLCHSIVDWLYAKHLKTVLLSPLWVWIKSAMGFRGTNGPDILGGLNLQLLTKAVCMKILVLILESTRAIFRSCFRKDKLLGKYKEETCKSK